MKRLRKLNVVLTQFNDLSEDERLQIFTEFHDNVKALAVKPSTKWSDSGKCLGALRGSTHVSQAEVLEEENAYGVRYFDDEIVDVYTLHEVIQAVPLEQELNQEEFNVEKVSEPIISDTERSIEHSTLLQGDAFEHFIDTIPHNLASLYRSFLNSHQKLSSLLASTSSSTPDKEEATIQTAEYAMSKTQSQLTKEEGKIWEQLASYKASPTATTSPLPALMTLTQKSRIISTSYIRTASPASAKTYMESREIISAMGVPCIITEGAYEAEALASSLVLHGHADFVASEDTDVLVYEAPLIRNITNRQVPLVLMSGADIRSKLDLTRESFVDFALLLGTDFSQRIKNVGPSRALKFIKAYGSIEKVVEEEKEKYPIASIISYLEQVNMAREVFQTLPPLPDKAMLQQGSRKEEEVVKIMQKYGLGREVILDSEVEDRTGSTLSAEDLWKLDSDEESEYAGT